MPVRQQRLVQDVQQLGRQLPLLAWAHLPPLLTWAEQQSHCKCHPALQIHAFSAPRHV